MNKMPNDAHNITHEKIYTEAYFYLICVCASCITKQPIMPQPTKIAKVNVIKCKLLNHTEPT